MLAFLAHSMGDRTSALNILSGLTVNEAAWSMPVFRLQTPFRFGLMIRGLLLKTLLFEANKDFVSAQSVNALAWKILSSSDIPTHLDAVLYFFTFLGVSNSCSREMGHLCSWLCAYLGTFATSTCKTGTWRPVLSCVDQPSTVTIGCNCRFAFAPGSRSCARLYWARWFPTPSTNLQWKTKSKVSSCGLLSSD